jgi:phospholipid/cholesterol/gamma-HCH transport system permease protein
VLSTLSMTEVLVSLLKSLVFGLVISVTSCYYGMRAIATVTAIPRAATGAVMRNLLTVFLLDGVITYVFFA